MKLLRVPGPHSSSFKFKILKMGNLRYWAQENLEVLLAWLGRVSQTLNLNALSCLSGSPCAPQVHRRPSCL